MRFSTSAECLNYPCRTPFEGAAFSGGAIFIGATFSGGANFRGAAFSRTASFRGAAFYGAIYFHEAAFSERADFSYARFLGRVHFERGTFSEEANFRRAAFSEWADFRSAAFSAEAYFGDAVFIGTTFDNATISGDADFRDSVFNGASSFVNAEMKSITSFKGATFKTKPPEFFGAELHEGTVWPGRKAWPIPKWKDEADDFVRAYERLKLEMDHLKKHEDELDFFALELQSRRVWLGTWMGLPITIYGALSDYGRSYLRPPVALFYMALIGTLAFLPSDSLSPWQSLGLSFANSLNVFGFRKDFFDAATIERLPALLKILAAVQTIFGTILLFLFVLGIRNKFRMK